MTVLSRIPIEALVTLALLIVYAVVYSGRFYSPDGMVMFRQAESIVFDHSIHFRYPVWGLGPIRDSSYGIGLSLVYVPILAVLGAFLPHTPLVPTTLVGGQTDWAFYTQELYHDPIYRFVAPVHAVVAAATAWLVARVVIALGFQRREVLWSMVFVGLASPLLVYSRGDFAQPLEGLCWVAALLCALKRGPWYMVALGFAVFYAILTRPVEGSILAAGCFLLVLGNRNATVATVAGGTAGVGVTLLINLARFGSPFEAGYGGYTWTHSLVGVAGLLWSPARGLLWWFPGAFIAVAGVRVLWGANRRFALTAAVLSLTAFLSAAFWPFWWGGLAWGPRLELPGIPLLAVLAGIGMSRVPFAVGAVAALIGFATSAPALVLDIFRGYGVTAQDSPFSWLAYPPRQLAHWFRIRTPTDILGNPQLRGDIDNFWAHLPLFYGFLAAAVVVELVVLVLILQLSRRPPARSLPA